MSTEVLRIVVVGTSCAGKTTFAQRLAQVLAVPHIELDVLHWQPKWTPRDLHSFQALIEQAIMPERWVVDGNYSTLRNLVWSRATTVIWLNYGLPTVLWRAFTRTVGRVVRQEELYAGNRESWRRTFLSRESILWWVMTTFHRRRREYRGFFETPVYCHLTTIELQKPREAEELLRHLRANP